MTNEMILKIAELSDVYRERVPYLVMPEAEEYQGIVDEANQKIEACWLAKLDKLVDELFDLRFGGDSD